MRLFAAVLPPDAATAELATAARALKELPGADGLRWTARDSWHFTLAFMAEVDDATVPDLTARLQRAAHRTPPFSLALHGGGHFGGRALWAGATGDVAALRLLAARADAAARKAGVTMEEHRHYRPHLTLARTRGEGDLGPYADALGSFEGTAWTVRELTLVRSNLPRSGVAGERPRYEVVGRWVLGGGAGVSGGAG
ncbi:MULTISPECIES: RNA 2',3'-cyclic phosphodiesterase [Streptomyces]|uniref:RNA 2',3'-cyclic phosphodiesterase n=7 Tax=Streptomyces TaxID=1883 RepID=A0A5P2BFI8_STRVZ|nr:MULTISPECIES: RNA 2',3'-cyclic phosphodiesterase [Streptomyces]MYZ19139.1 RNA 2',3'-cyclic phosphodiesterase [Streptomyces sp. SID337]QES27891.1 RNA 2',3'-cyclic phosphodiesterase [Streptomyces venezuelae]